MKTITVTQDLIDTGERADCSMCPVARAITLSLPDGTSAQVRKQDGGGYVWRTGLQKAWWITDASQWKPFPPEVCTWIERFDAGDPCEPITFDLEVES